jgi:hypothetical protein
MTLVRWRRMISDRLVGTLLSQICQPISISLIFAFCAYVNILSKPLVPMAAFHFFVQTLMN